MYLYVMSIRLSTWNLVRVGLAETG
jgi:hypothetical protein